MRSMFLALALVLGACGDNAKPEPLAPSPDGPPPADAPPDSNPVGPLAPCLDRPTDLPGAPAGQLSCDLLPPGFTAQ